MLKKACQRMNMYFFGEEEAERSSEVLTWWDKKVELFWTIQDALESGRFVGEAYDELWEAKHILNEAESVAGRYADD